MIVALLLAIAFPSTDKTSWMRPESFHLIVGMPRADVVRTLESNGWKPKKGDTPEQLVVDYADDKTITMAFERDRLHSIRFELFTILHDAKGAFAEVTSHLREAYGKPKPLKSKTIILYDNALPNIMAVLANDPNSTQGQKGVGMVVVRYYDPR